MAACNNFDKKTFINFLSELGVDIRTNTKARGNQGFFLKNRIDVSKDLSSERQVQVMAHEFAHYIHSKIEPDMNITKGSLEKLFCTPYTEIIEEELKTLTLKADKNAQLIFLYNKKDELIKRIKEKEIAIKNFYPDFKRSEKFKEFEKYIKKSKARFLLKHDKIKYITPFLRKIEYYSIENLEKDFPSMPKAFSSYIRLNSLQKKRAAISKKIRKYEKYYAAPNELFARFIESFFIDENLSKLYTPTTRFLFFKLLDEGHFFELKKLFCIANLYN